MASAAQPSRCSIPPSTGRSPHPWESPNTAAFAVNLVAGWALHSRWSFANRSASGPARTAYSRYFAVNAASYALNSIWVWTIVERLHGSVALSIIPVVTITPAFTFALNRAWIFRSRL